MSLTDILNNAREALSAQSYGLQVAGQNVSNVNTPDYVRRRALLEARPTAGTSFGSVHVAGLERVSNEFLQRQFLGAVGMSAYASSRDQYLGQVESVYNDFGDAGLGQSLRDLLDSFSELGQNPQDSTVRSKLLANADGLTMRIRSMAETLNDFRAQLVRDAQDSTKQVNQLTKDIAKLNGDILLSENQGNDAADLKDFRDGKIAQLSEFVDVRSFTNTKGEYVIQAAGSTIVEGTSARSLSIKLDGSGNMQLLSTMPPGAPMDMTSYLSGGKLAGIFQVRDTDLTSMQSDLDQLAFDFSTAVNTQHQAGFGLDSVGGRDIFTPAVSAAGYASIMALSSDVAGNPDAVAASGNSANGPGDSDNAKLLAALANSGFMSGGNTPTEAYANTVGKIGMLKSAARMEVINRDAIAAQVSSAKDSTTAVNLDEEMISLTKFQRAYEASARVLNTADELLAQLIQSL